MLASERLWNRALRTPDLTDRERLNLRNLVLDTVWLGPCSAGIGAFVSVFLVRLGASNLLVGLLVSLPALVALVLTVPGGMLVEGRRDILRLVVLSRLSIRFLHLFIALVPFFVLGQTAAIAIVVLWACIALPNAISAPGWTAVIAEAIPSRVRPQVNGLRWASVSIVSAIVAAVFGWVLDSVVFPGNYQVVFAVSVVAGFVSLYYFNRIRLPETAEIAPIRRQANPLDAVADLARTFRSSQSFVRFIVTAFVFRLGLNMPVALFAIFWVQHLDAADSVIGLRATAGNATLVVGYFVWAYIAARRGSRLVLIACTLGYSAYPVLTAIVPGPLWLLPVAVVWGLFVPGIDIAFFEAMLHTCPPDRRPSFLAINTTTVNLAALVAPLAGAILTDVLGIRTVLGLSGGICLLGALLFVLLPVLPLPQRIESSKPVGGEIGHAT